MCLFANDGCFCGMARQLPPALGGGAHGTARAFRGRTRAEVSDLIGMWRRFVETVRDSVTLQETLKEEGLGPTVEIWQNLNRSVSYTHLTLPTILLV